MTAINNHIENYLNYYCSLQSPDYAVLLKGSWGAGKTWFIKYYCDRLKEKNRKFLYVPLLNGLWFTPKAYNKNGKMYVDVSDKNMICLDNRFFSDVSAETLSDITLYFKGEKDFTVEIKQITGTFNRSLLDNLIAPDIISQCAEILTSKSFEWLHDDTNKGRIYMYCVLSSLFGMVLMALIIFVGFLIYLYLGK